MSYSLKKDMFFLTLSVHKRIYKHCIHPQQIERGSNLKENKY